ncbi:T9SS type A sorting domain-containing protein [bacterium]|nr:T9SS type A sorting domain-containing protein [bacterium]
MKKRLFCAMLIMACLYAATAAGDGSWRQFTTADGLPANEVRAIAEDANGVLWFGTDGGGVARYDGESWTVYGEKDGLVNNEARELAFDKDGVLWVGTPRGVSSFDGVKWNIYTTENSGLVSNYVIALAVDKNNVKWFGTIDQGVSIFDGTSWKTLTEKDGLPGNKITAIAFSENGNVWIGSDRGATCFDGVTWKTYNTENSGISHNLVLAIKEDGNHTMWFGTRRGVSSFNGSSWTVYSARTKHNILDTRCIYTIDIDKDGTLWFGSTMGMWSYDGNNWVSYTRFESNLKNDVYVRAIHTDTVGKKWVGARDAMTTRLSDQPQIMKKSSQPTQMKIVGNYPNPFNPETTIEFVIAESGYVSLDVYNIAGQKIRTLVTENMMPGIHTAVWNGQNDAGTPVASGVYFFRLKMGETVLHHRIMLTR